MEKVNEVKQKTYTTEQLVSAGGRLWEVAEKNMRRVYFNSLADRIGLSVSYYKTGNVSSASLNGEGISNTKARKILSTLEFGKVWYDLNTNRFETKNLGDYAEEIIESIENDLNSKGDKMTNQKPKNLNELFEMMKNNSCDLPRWDLLPTFGGPEIRDTTEVWSWDATRKIVGTCPDDIEIVSRMYMAIETGDVDTYDGWDYETEDGETVNAVDLGEVVEVTKDEGGSWIEA